MTEMFLCFPQMVVQDQLMEVSNFGFTLYSRCQRLGLFSGSVGLCQENYCLHNLQKRIGDEERSRLEASGDASL